MSPDSTGKKFLLFGSSASFALALFHIVIIFVGAPGYRYFGAGEEMASLDEAGSWIPALVTSGIVMILSGFGFYGLSVAGVIRRLPLVRTALIGICGIYTLRGLGIIGDIFMIAQSPAYPFRALIFSFVSLSIGLAYLAGILKSWKDLSQIPSRM